MEFFVPIWIGFAFITAIAASARNRSFLAWLLIGALFGVFALLAVLVMKPETEGHRGV